MKIVFGLLAAVALAAKGGKRGLHGRAPVDIMARSRVKKNQKQSTIDADGGSIKHRNYPENEKIKWTVKAKPGNSVVLQFDKVFELQHHLDCAYDAVTITPVFNGKAGAPHTFCGPNKQEFLTMPTEGMKAGVKFPKGKKGQKAWDYPWDTYTDEVLVEFESDGELSGKGFEIIFTETERNFECKTRKDCMHIQLNKHVCDFDPISLDKVCREVACTKHTHCTIDIPSKTFEICKQNECEPVECTHRKHCDEQHVCNKERACEPVECTAHEHCAAKNNGRSKCNGQTNKCEDVKCVKATHCPAGHICQDNKCLKQECIGHAMCLSVKGCKDGRCLCASRKCVKHECVKNTHCDDECICQGRKCVCELDGKKVCRGHIHCTGNGGAQKCVDKICEDVECRTAAHCDKVSAVTGKSYLCNDENSDAPNTCFEVECKAHGECPEKTVCIENECVPTECRINGDCPVNHLCHRPSKKDPRKNKCKPVDCTSNAACKNHSNPACQDGRCMCEKNECVVKACVKSEHCPEKENCHDNVCTPVDCKSHDDCVGFFGEGQPAKCFPNCFEETKINPANGKEFTKTYCSPECRKVACRLETDCDASVPEICDGETNKCKAVECRGHHFCTEKAFPRICKDGKCNCQDNKCKKVECADNTHCDLVKKEVCSDNQCVKVECTSHDHCGAFGRCRDKKCVTVDCKENDQCSRTGNVLEKCDKPNGKCVQIECVGHASCDRMKNTEAGEDCRDGKCMCLENHCEKKECRHNDHCGFKQRCRNNVCEKVECTAHEHCKGNGGAQQCKGNVCVDVECRDVNHCGDKQVCGGEDSGNTCIDVDCLGHADCEENFGDKFLCFNHTCEEQECRINDHCNEGDPDGRNVCAQNKCTEVECSSHDHCAATKGTDYKCLQNQCVKVECRIAADHCAEDELCDKETNECFQVDCRGHAMCESKAKTDPILFGHCADGHCLCVANKCEAQECRINDHCAVFGERMRCRNNLCEEVQCNAHDQCIDHDERQDCKDGKCRCVANQCELSECRNNLHCASDEICSGEKPIDGSKPNICVEVECRGHEMCQAGGVAEHCINHKCEPVECTNESHCDGDKELCQNSKCVEQECRAHEHCVGFFGKKTPAKCINRECQKVECTSAVDCAADELCDKQSNTCFKPECKGHASCELVKGCKDGKCTCTENKCVKHECRTNSHCPEQHRCKNLECQKVECTSHDHCADKKDTKGICKENKCKQVQCKTMPDCHVLMGETNWICEGNKCGKVECTRNTDCIGPAICKDQKCIQMECVANSDCKSGQFCGANTCMDL